MDYNELFNLPSWDPRPSLLALRDRGIRVVITPDGLRFIGPKRAARPFGSSRAVEPAFRPRDEIGRFVGYWVLPTEFDSDLLDIWMDSFHSA